MTNEERRLSIFNLYSSNWKLVRPRFQWADTVPESHHHAVMCPLCLGIFNMDFLNQELANPLTLEHVPPKRLGGKPRLLSCKECNNESGRLVDYAIAQYLNNEPFMRLDDGAEILGKTIFNHSNGKSIKSRTIIRVEKKNTFIFKAQINRGEWREKELEKVDPKAPIQINFQFSTPSTKRIHAGLLRVAYLMAFEKFGHGFVLNEVYNGIRQQILEPDKEILEPFGCMVTDSVGMVDGFYFALTPFNSKCFVVVFTLKNNQKMKKACVFLPSPYENSIEFYNKFKALPSQKFNVTTKGSFPEFGLTDKDLVFSFMQVFK